MVESVFILSCFPQALHRGEKKCGKFWQRLTFSQQFQSGDSSSFVEACPMWFSHGLRNEMSLSYGKPVGATASKEMKKNEYLAP
jgi:hypothetical protein